MTGRDGSVTTLEEIDMLKTTVLAAFVAIATSAAAFAQTATPPAAAPATTAAAKHEDGAGAKFRAACGADIAKLCGDVKPVADATADQKKESRGKMRACLTTHKAELSTGCKTVVDEREANIAEKKKS